MPGRDFLYARQVCRRCSRKFPRYGFEAEKAVSAAMFLPGVFGKRAGFALARSRQRECVYRFNRFSNQEKGIASMSSLLFRFLPLHVCWLASFGIILAYRSSLTTTAFIVFLLLLVTGAYGTLALLRKLSAGLLWLFYVAVFICWGCDAFFVMAAGRNTAVLILGGLPFALLLAPVLVLSLAFMMEQGTIRIRTILAAICFHTSCLPVLILATLLIVS